MIEITEKSNCCGCTACKNICPKGCIEMKPDLEGFLYPEVDLKRCIDCGACEKVCPILNHQKKKDKLPEAYALRSRDVQNVMESTSGGFTMPLAQWVFDQKGCFWGVVFDEQHRIRHACFDTIGEDFAGTRGSKYVQSDLGDCFSRIKQQLTEGRIVCFIGTVCQVYGLKHFLRKEYDNLITVDLVCHGTPSPKLWEKYVAYQEEKHHAAITSINFRHKTYGYHSGTMRLTFDNGKVYTGSARVDYMLKSFFTEISSRPSCYDCRFKQISRISDFTVFDCWHITQLTNGTIKDDDKGFTNLFVHTEKGARLLQQLKDCYELYPTDAQLATELDGIMVCNSVKKHPRRDEFYQDLDDHDLPAHIQKYIPISKMDHLLEASKIIAYRLGLIPLLQKIKNRKK